MIKKITLSDEHEYTVDGISMPSVTGILTDVLGDPTNGWGKKWHMDRGSAAHALYAIMGRGEDVAKYNYDARLQGYVDLWQDWRSRESVDVVAVEHKVASVRYGYAGTLDLCAVISGRQTIIDYKATSSKRDKLQLAAYKVAWEEMGLGAISQVASLQIDGDRWQYAHVLSGIELRAAVADWHAVRRAYELKQQ